MTCATCKCSDICKNVQRDDETIKTGFALNRKLNVGCTLRSSFVETELTCDFGIALSLVSGFEFPFQGGIDLFISFSIL